MHIINVNFSLAVSLVDTGKKDDNSENDYNYDKSTILITFQRNNSFCCGFVLKRNLDLDITSILYCSMENDKIGKYDV